MITHIYTDGTEWNLAGISVRAGFADLLVGENAAQNLRQSLKLENNIFETFYQNIKKSKFFSLRKAEKKN